MAHRVGQKLGHYRLTRLLGSGGFAEVYLAEHLYLTRQVAIKLLHTTLEETQRTDFLQEAQRLLDLSHPHIVRMLDFAFDGQTPFLIMEYAPNGTMRKRYPKHTRLAPQIILPYVKQVASALAHIHHRKLVHRDIKPENMLLGANQEILLSDFGIASVAHTTGSLSLQGQDGTPAYMAPEQLRGKPRPASDQYALGITVYEWLCGHCPFQGTAFEIATQHLSVAPPPLREKVPTLTPSLEAVVFKALEKDPQARYPSVADFADAFERACNECAEPVSPLSGQHRVPSLSSTPPPLHPPARPRPDEETPTPVSPRVSRPTRNTPLPPAPSPPSPLEEPSPQPLPEKHVANSADRVPASLASRQSPPAFPLSEPGRKKPEQHFAPSPPTASEKDIRPSGRIRKRPLSLRITVLLIALTVVVGGVAWTQIFTPLAHFVGMSSATVTIVPDSKLVSNQYEILAVPGAPNADAKQIAMRTITSQAQSPARVVNATGHAQAAGAVATGTLTFINGSGNSFTVAVGTIFTNANGVQVATDTAVVIPAANPPTVGSATASAHAVVSGASGNIAAQTINSFCCVAGNFMKVSNPNAFTGGMDPKNYAFVQQSDVDGMINNVVDGLKQQAQASAMQQMKPGEQLAGDFNCPKAVKTDAQPGDHAINVSSLNVTVTVTCSGQVYDKLGMQSIVNKLLSAKATADLGAGYTLVSTITMSSKMQQGTDQNGLTFLVNASGMWAYQFSDTQKQALSKMIAGKSVSDARTILTSQKGIKSVTIEVQGANNPLPSEASLITVVVQNVPTAPPNGTPSGG